MDVLRHLPRLGRRDAWSLAIVLLAALGFFAVVLDSPFSDDSSSAAAQAVPPPRPRSVVVIPRSAQVRLTLVGTGGTANASSTDSSSLRWSWRCAAPAAVPVSIELRTPGVGPTTVRETTMTGDDTTTAIGPFTVLVRAAPSCRYLIEGTS